MGLALELARISRWNHFLHVNDGLIQYSWNSAVNFYTNSISIFVLSVELFALIVVHSESFDHGLKLKRSTCPTCFNVFQRINCITRGATYCYAMWSAVVVSKSSLVKVLNFITGCNINCWTKACLVMIRHAATNETAPEKSLSNNISY
jgi:hypothetical protein